METFSNVTTAQLNPGQVKKIEQTEKHILLHLQGNNARTSLECGVKEEADGFNSRRDLVIDPCMRS